ncbi:ABC transporter permease [Micromonospora endolithica]|uniref:ABC transporter permease n=1 Tax=Micromonospora endolithica TaxID=230091 RepID=A0A3A9YRT6_9ACTN|nr:ABC transporter permease [Micromonospora endolithica]RKN38675.1 ABC transporter permease [Micromonospora endolithica]TWJ25290.1 FtsX-like permease family protein [Micromonospora endolithica]
MKPTGVVGLAAQLATGSPRSRKRFLLTAAGMAVAAIFLLAGSVALPLNEAQRDRAADRAPTLERGAVRSDGTLLARRWTDVYLDRKLLVTEVAAARSNAPPPPGLDRLPLTGEIVVSPAVRDALRADATLRERYPHRVVGTVGDAGLTGPREWTVWIGAAPEAFPADYVPASGWGARPEDVPPLPGGLRLAVPIGLAALLLPLLALVVNAVRWGSQERDRRLAALRLSGMSAMQVRLLTAIEVGMAAAIGSIGGGLIFLTLAAAVAARLPGEGAFLADALPPIPAATAIVVGLPVFATATAVVALRRVVVNPMGVVRRRAVVRSGRWRLLPLVVGLLMACWLFTTDQTGSAAVVPLFLAALLIMIGLLVGAPTLCLGVAGLMLRMDGSPAVLLAARRAQASAATAARVVGVVTLLVFASGWFLAVLPLADGSTPASLTQLEQRLKPHTLLANVERAPAPGELELPGVTGVAHLVTVELGRSGEGYAGVNAVAGDCSALSSVLRVPLPECGPESTYLTPSEGAKNPLSTGEPLAAYQYGSESADGVEYVELGPVRLGKIVDHALDGLGELGIGAGIVPVSRVPQQALHVAPVRQLLVTVSSSDPVVVERVRTAVQRLQEGSSREVRDVEMMVREAQSVSQTYRQVAWAGLVLAFVVSTLSLAVALLDRLLEERRGIAALRAQGVTVRTLRLVLLGQTAANLLPGALVGMVCTIPMAEAFFVVSEHPELTVPWAQLAATTAGCGLAVIGVVALMLPALREAIDTRLLVVD